MTSLWGFFVCLPNKKIKKKPEYEEYILFWPAPLLRHITKGKDCGVPNDFLNAEWMRELSHVFES